MATPGTSYHTRQPAYSIAESDEEKPRERERSFSEDVAGMLASIGHDSPARELGLAPDSVRRTPRDLQVELGRSDSNRSADRLKPRATPSSAMRTTSLPSPQISPQPEAGPSKPRVTSSPNPLPDDVFGQATLGEPLFGPPLSPKPSSVRLVTSPRLVQSPDIADTVLDVPPEDDEERGRRLACEYLENDYESQDKVAIFLGGP